MALKKYELVVYYDTESEEVVHLSEYFSDCDEYKMIINNKEITVPSDMQDYISKLDLDDMGVS